MIKQLLLSILFSCVVLNSYGQGGYQLTQYFQNAPVINPAFTGTDNFTDIRIGYKQQWTGIESGGRTFYASAYGLLIRSKYDKLKSNSLRISDPSLYEGNKNKSFKRSAAIKHGIGGYIINDSFGPFNRTNAFLTYSFHYPLNPDITMALGLSGGINSAKIDANQITVQNPDIDVTYQAFLADGATSNNIDINTGILFYSNKFYLGYSLQRLLQNPIFNNDEFSNEKESLNHVVSAGYILPLSADYLFQPSVVSIIRPGLPSIINLSAKLRYQNSYWLGLNYRDSQAFSIMGGVFINKSYSLSYSYDFSLNGFSEYLQGSHEIVLGIMLNNERGFVPFAW
jgi:type IX secretion system PorP/SprF family membrane protein